MKSSFLYLMVWLIVCGATFVGYGMWYLTIAEASSTVAHLQQQIDTKTRASDRVALARATFAEIADDEAAVQSHFVPETGVVTFINALETIAYGQKAKMKVLSVSTGEGAKQPTLLFSLTVSGTFDAVMRTIGAIEYAPYDLSVTKLSVTQGEKNFWRADLDIVVGSVPLSVATSTPVAPQKTISLSYP